MVFSKEWGKNKNGDVFDLDGKQVIVMGGTCSIDKMVRLMYGYGWWPDEQPSDEIKRYVWRAGWISWGGDNV